MQRKIAAADATGKLSWTDSADAKGVPRERAKSDPS